MDNNKGEYCNDAFNNICRKVVFKDNFFYSSDPYMPEQDSLSERLNRTLLDKARVL